MLPTSGPGDTVRILGHWLALAELVDVAAKS
jgi:hypothetical protein